MIVVVRKLGGSLAVIIPNAIASEMGLTEGISLDVTTDDASLILRRRGRRAWRSLRSLVSQINPKSYARCSREIGADQPASKEDW